MLTRWLRTPAQIGGLLCILLTGGCTGLPMLPASGNGPYRLDSGDQVRVIVYNQESLSAAYTVSDNGTISFPMLGEIKARALTPQELQKEIYDGLGNGVLVNPGISVEVTQYRPFFIVGEVAKPGQYPYVSGLNVLTAVAMAGGFTVRADETHPRVVRKKGNEAAQWRAQQLSSLQPGDLVVIPERFF